MNTTREIIEKAGGTDRVAASLGVHRRRVVNALSDEKLPASWYAGLCTLTGRKNLPRGLFTFKEAAE